ncbi:hypothetical protein GCK32_002081 [Trichostrongylus colubriformis]|uniref:Uncharacterized protein n=1 Tax=Trichostrongylus colubriformis TaxID=6319 RepID=A0AAN8IIN8_TRICO
MNALILSRHGKELSDISRISRGNISLLDEKRSFFSRLFLFWLSPLLKKGSRKTLIYDDLPSLKQKYRSINLLRKWKIGSRDRIVRKLLVRYRWSVLGAVAAKLLAEVFDFLNPILLKLLIEAASHTGLLSQSLTICVVMFACGEIKSLFLGIHNYLVVRDASTALALIVNSVSKKSLRLASWSRVQWPTGRVVNLVAVDAEGIAAAAPYAHHLWSAVLEVVIALSLLYFTIGPPVLAAVVIMILYIPFNYCFSLIIKSYQTKQMRMKDNRVEFTKEVLHGITVVKMYAWEEAFEKEIRRLRDEEVELLMKATLLTRVLQAVNAAAPFLVAIACFSWFVLSSSNNSLKPSVAFVALTIFNQLRRPMGLIAPAIQFVSKAMVSSKRINDFLQADELVRQKESANHEDTASILLENCFFSWGKEKEHLKDITLEVQKEEVHAIVGSFGSGKSSVLSAILGEMTQLDGVRKIAGTIAYVPQTAWILNQTVRNNILYGMDYDSKKYDKVLRACELKKDIFALPRCDATIVGENGTTLSGGQRARICLARALYQDCDIYLLDEPFSAVDARIAKSMFEKILGPNGLLAKKTVVLVTQSIEFTKVAAVIHVMEGGKIVDRGSYEELLDRSSIFSEIKRELEEIQKKKKTSEDSTIRRHKKPKTVMFEPPQPPNTRQLEEVAAGNIEFNVYLMYLKAFSYKWALLFFALLFCRYVMQALSSIWLSSWADANDKETNGSNTMRGLIVFVALGLGTVLFNIIANVSSTFGGIRASVALHHPLVTAIMRAPLSFFEETPLGRILSRLVGDIHIVDIPLPINIRLVVDSLMHTVMILVVISISMPAYVIFVVPFTIAYAMIIKYFLPTNRQIKRIESAQRSQVLAVLSQNFEGAESIRAYGRVKSTMLSFNEEVDSFTRCRYLVPATERWLALRLELIGNIMVLACSVLVSLFHEMSFITSGEIGLCVSYALSLTDMMNFSTRMMALSDANVVAVERIKEYHDIESEEQGGSDYPLLDAWPHSGAIDFYKFSIRYGEKFAVKEMTLSIKGGEKVGIVGRTGSGKTSITRGLLRLTEKSSGDVFIDGVNISDLSLHELRSRITIIPQDPVLFSSTLRFNVDPFDRFADSDIWLALEACQLKEMVSKHEHGLMTEIEEGGKNISIGERQLLCLCRSLLEGGAIVILDEATASLDHVTQALVDAVVREHFRQATTITIAHNLETVGECDRIAVMEDGELVEFDTPDNLLAKEDSIYRELVEAKKY